MDLEEVETNPSSDDQTTTTASLTANTPDGLDMFALDDDTSCSSMSSEEEDATSPYTSLDQCLDACSLAKVIHSQKISGTRK